MTQSRLALFTHTGPIAVRRRTRLSTGLLDYVKAILLLRQRNPGDIGNEQGTAPSSVYTGG